ncbi:MAG: glycosyltransferase family 39 protein [Sedimentisphaerales bacterium]|nr:glycosyltransferase family 39 protein [Sedimentisphaerales bacterium]
MTDRMSRSWNTWLVLLILLVGLGLRLHQLGRESFWFDEGVSIARSDQSLSGLLANARRAGGNPPGYFLLLHYWIGLFGRGEAAVRMLSVVFGALCLSLAYRMGRLLFDRRTACLTLLLVALSGFHFYYAQEARCYAMLAALGLLSMELFIRWRRRPTAPLAAGYLVTSIALVYTHYYGPLLLAAQNLFLLAFGLDPARRTPIAWRRWILLQGAAALSFVPWMHILASKTAAIQQTKLHLARPSVWDIPGTLKTYAGENIVLGIFFILLAGSSLRLLKRTRGSRGLESLGRQKAAADDQAAVHAENVNSAGLTAGQTLYFLGIWLATPILLPFLVSQVSTPIFGHKYTIAASFAFYLLVAAGINQVRRRYGFGLILAVLLLVYPLRILTYYRQLDKEPWRTVVGQLEARAHGGDLVLIHSSHCLSNIYAYYAKRDDLVIATLPGRGNRIGPEQLEALPGILGGHDRVWLVYSHVGENSEALLRQLQQRYPTSRVRDYFRIRLFFYERPGEDSTGRPDPMPIEFFKFAAASADK